eukprot:TRINITY_DN12116_c0_g2_i1.p1 TRINITY_DN12116_c0_g2~~TRINITY_DN12116_c0_g2_i1.p1  ORF type:complete len:874 (-),score=172.21 TRINITY_DN12116_c0_g2_i1:97-2718(-)
MPSHNDYVGFNQVQKKQSEFRVLFLGSAKAGKSSLITRHTEEFFVKAYEPNSETYYTIHSEDSKLGKIPVTYYDPSGRDSFRVIIKPLYKEATFLVYVYDVTDRSSFEALKQYHADYQAVRGASKNLPCIVVANKADAETKRWQVSLAAAEKWAESILADCEVHPCSSLDGSGVEDLFSLITEVSLERKEEEVKEDIRRRRPPPVDDTDPLDEIVYIHPSAIPADGVMPVVETSLLPTIIKSYEGDLDDAGCYQGDGRAIFINSVVYEGQFKDGALEGKGMMEWPSGTVYQGQFHQNTITGHGVMQWPDDTRYEGEFLNGLRHGQGRFTCPTGDVFYEGSWENGERSGQGTLFYDPEGLIRYEGEWAGNVRHGHGVMKFASGAIYDGQWHNGTPQGKGTMQWPDRKEEYTGSWRAGRPHGRGTHVWLASLNEPHLYPQLNKYHGAFHEGLRDGYGVFYYASGAVYEGMWQNNLKHGRGKMTFANGSVYQGPYADDVPVSEDGIPVESDVAVAEVPTNVRALVYELLGGEAADEEDISAVTTDITKAILRVLPELKQVYDSYTTLSLDAPDAISHRAALLQYGMWRVLLDAGITSPAVSLVWLDQCLDLNPVAVTTQREAEAGSTPLPPAHAPTSLLLFRQFLSSLIRIAQVVHCPDEGSVHITLAPAVTSVLHSVAALVGRDPTEPLGGSAAHTVVRRYHHHLWNLYNELSDHDARRGERNMDGLPNVREVLLMLKDKNVMSDSVTVTSILEHAANRFTGLVGAGYGDENSAPAPAAALVTGSTRTTPVPRTPGPAAVDPLLLTGMSQLSTFSEALNPAFADNDLATIDQELTYAEFIHTLQGTLDGGPLDGEPREAQMQFLCARILFPDVVV